MSPREEECGHKTIKRSPVFIALLLLPSKAQCKLEECGKGKQIKSKRPTFKKRRNTSWCRKKKKRNLEDKDISGGEEC